MEEENMANSSSDRGSIQTCDPVKVKERSGFKKEGYKKTKLGWIPEDWEIKPISSMGKVITGSTPSTNDSSYYGDDYLFVSPGDMDGVKFVVETSKKLTKSGFDTGRLVKKGSTLFVAIGSTIGKTAIAGEDLITNQQINSIVAGEKNNDQFIFHQLTHQAKRIALLAGRQAVPIINKTSFSKVLIIRPPLPEQQKIAAILSTWDRAIAKQEQLINAKQEFKKGLMQLLLTGKKRFEGFEGEWELKFLSDIMTIGNGRDYKHLSPGDIPVYGTGGIMRYVNDYLFDGESVGIGRKGTIDKPVFLQGKFWTVDTLFYCHSFKESLALYVYYLFLTINWKNYNEASGVPSLSQNTIKKIIVSLPSVKEQQKIASVLSAADKEIGLLQSELATFRGQKRGLMQRLLTGEVRVRTI